MNIDNDQQELQLANVNENIQQEVPPLDSREDVAVPPLDLSQDVADPLQIYKPQLIFAHNVYPEIHIGSCYNSINSQLILDEDSDIEMIVDGDNANDNKSNKSNDKQEEDESEQEELQESKENLFAAHGKSTKSFTKRRLRNPYSKYIPKYVHVSTDSFECDGGLEFDLSISASEAVSRIQKYVRKVNRHSKYKLDLIKMVEQHEQKLMKYKVIKCKSKNGLYEYNIDKLITFANMEFCWKCGKNKTNIRCIGCGAWAHEQCVGNSSSMSIIQKYLFQCDLCMEALSD